MAWDFSTDLEDEAMRLRARGITCEETRSPEAVTAHD
jgi:hypothetical protein